MRRTHDISSQLKLDIIFSHLSIGLSEYLCEFNVNNVSNQQWQQNGNIIID